MTQRHPSSDCSGLYLLREGFLPSPPLSGKRKRGDVHVLEQTKSFGGISSVLRGLRVSALRWTGSGMSSILRPSPGCDTRSRGQEFSSLGVIEHSRDSRDTVL